MSDQLYETCANLDQCLNKMTLCILARVGNRTLEGEEVFLNCTNCNCYKKRES